LVIVYARNLSIFHIAYLHKPIAVERDPLPFNGIDTLCNNEQQSD
jgi:hypothetical protein